MSTSPLTGRQLAAALQIDPGLVSRDRKRGMPVHSVEAARAWRAENVGLRYRPTRGAVLAASELLDAAALRLAAGGELGELEPRLRAALRGVPEHRRDDFLADAHMIVIVALCRDALARVTPADPAEREAERRRASAMTEAEAAEVGAFWYSVAAGEWVLR